MTGQRISPRSLPRRAAHGELIVGHMVFELTTPAAPLLAQAARAQFLVVDTEHSPCSPSDLRAMALAARATDVVTMVRVARAGRVEVSRALDLGVQGVIAPRVESAATARSVVEWAKYPPLGSRGAAFGITHDAFQPPDIDAVIADENASVAVGVQIETVVGVSALSEIAATPGLDFLWLGQFDLTASLGIPGNFDDPTFIAAAEQIAAEAERNGIAAGMACTSIAESTAAVARGYRLIAAGTDVTVYRDALRTTIEQTRALGA